MSKPKGVHPVADLFPMLAGDELPELAEDIKARGLLHPIVLDGEGRILDGRNRFAACELAGIEPIFSTYDGGDPDGYALAVNIQRRNLTKGQQAMVAARSCKVSLQPTRKVANGLGMSAQRITQANVVLDHAPDMVDAVIAGATSLDEAYRVARERKTAADSVENQLARLRAEDPELAAKVVEGELTLTGAWAERKARAEEDQRRRVVATHLLCQHVVAIAQTRGTAHTIGYYDPAEALPGRAVTRQVIEDARAAHQRPVALTGGKACPSRTAGLRTRRPNLPRDLVRGVAASAGDARGSWSSFRPSSKDPRAPKLPALLGGLSVRGGRPGMPTGNGIPGQHKTKGSTALHG
jgi:ParB-like chromosome segregation protein Spo0J